MTKPSNNPNRLPLEKLKKRAYSIQSRLKDLGQPISLAHAYEALATSSGHRNWATMKSLTASSKPDLILGPGVIYRSKLQGAFHVGDPVPTLDMTKLVTISACDAAHHIEVVGPKRIDRTETLLNIAENSIRAGECLVYLTRTSDTNLVDRIKKITRKVSRTSDLLHVNALPSLSALKFNPFATGTAEELADTISEMIDVRGGRDSGSLIWRQRRRVMLEAILHPLVWLRDHSNEKLTAQTILSKLPLTEMSKVSQETDVYHEDILATLKTYLSSIPGYRLELGLDQRQLTRDQHAYNAMMVEKALEPLVTTYRHVFQPPKAVETLDKIVRDRNILIAHFPDLPQKEWDADSAISLLFNEVIKAAKMSNSVDHSITVIVDNCESALPTNLGDKMFAATDAGVKLVFGWQKTPLIPALKRSTSIHLDEQIQGLATVITPSALYELALPSLKA